MGRLEDQVALVTGGSRGFGRAICLAFAREGAHIAVNYHRSETDAHEVALQVENMGRKSLVVHADVGSNDAVKAMVEQVVDSFGRIDILVNNAGLLVKGEFKDIPLAEYDDMLRVNLLGVLQCTHTTIPIMIRQQTGRIINLSSQLSQVGGSGMAVYAATKGAINALTKSLAVELGPYGIRVNAIGPGSIRTDMNKDFFGEEFEKRRRSELPVRRMGSPDDVAHCAVFLASQESDFITGQMLNPNGGLVMVF